MSHGLIPTRPSQRYIRAVTLPTTAYFPIFPSSRLAIRFTEMLVVIAFTGSPPASAGFWITSPYINQGGYDAQGL
jgi:hypothetical protein